MEFELKQYLGKWFEIARIKNAFEPNMTNVTAYYELDDNNNIKIVNEGYNNSILFQIVGIGKTTNQNNILQVSFFNNIFSDYKILYVDEEYQYAIVGGKTADYLWILSRTPQLDEDIIKQLLEIAKENNYNINKISLTKQKYD